MKTAIKNSNLMKLPIKNFREKNTFDNQKKLPKDLMAAVEDVRLNRNLHGSFETAEEAVKSMLED